MTTRLRQCRLPVTIPPVTLTDCARPRGGASTLKIIQAPTVQNLEDGSAAALWRLYERSAGVSASSFKGTRLPLFIFEEANQRIFASYFSACSAVRRDVLFENVIARC